MGSSLRSIALFLLTVLGLGVLAVAPAAAQDGPMVVDTVVDMDFDRPEAWGLKFFSSASLLTSLGPAKPAEPGGVDLGFELMSVPHLDTQQRTIGFRGTKEEDLNRSPVWARLRARFALGTGFSATLGVIPPLEVEGLKAALISGAIERPLTSWSNSSGAPGGLGARVFAQVGSAKGDLTCSHNDLEPGVANPFGCEELSTDEVTLEYRGLELSVWQQLGNRERAPSAYAGVSVQELDLEFQVDALTFGFRDRTLLLADGTTWAVTAGVQVSLAHKLTASAELFYTPLDVIRDEDLGSESDDLVNLRFLLTRRFGK